MLFRVSAVLYRQAYANRNKYLKTWVYDTAIYNKYVM
jgi:hypothetical protein